MLYFGDHHFHSALIGELLFSPADSPVAVFLPSDHTPENNILCPWLQITI